MIYLAMRSILIKAALYQSQDGKPDFTVPVTMTLLASHNTIYLDSVLLQPL